MYTYIRTIRAAEGINLVQAYILVGLCVLHPRYTCPKEKNRPKVSWIKKRSGENCHDYPKLTANNDTNHR